MTTGVYQSDNFRPTTGAVEQEQEDNTVDTSEDLRDKENLGLDVDVIFRNSDNFRDGQGQGRGQNGETLSGFGDLGLEEPEKSSEPEKGRSVYEKIVMMLFAYAQSIMDRRADRLEQMEKIGQTLTELAEQESNKFIEKVKKAQEKQKTGILGKIFAIIGLIVAAVIAVLTIAAVPFTGGLSIAALPAFLPSIAAIAGVAFAAFGAGDALFNDSKLMNKIMEETIGKMMEGLKDLLKKAGMSDKAANGVAIGLMAVVMIVATLVIAKGMHVGGNIAIKAQQNALNAGVKEAAEKGTQVAVKAGSTAAGTGGAAAGSTGSATAQAATTGSKVADITTEQLEDAMKAVKLAPSQLDDISTAGKAQLAAKHSGLKLTPQSTLVRQDVHALMRAGDAADAAEEAMKVAAKTKTAGDAAKATKAVEHAKELEHTARVAKTTQFERDARVLADAGEDMLKRALKSGDPTDAKTAMHIVKEMESTIDKAKAAKATETAASNIKLENIGDLATDAVATGSNAAKTGQAAGAVEDAATTGSNATKTGQVAGAAEDAAQTAEKGKKLTIKAQLTKELEGLGDQGAILAQGEKLKRMATYNRWSFRFQVGDAVNDFGTTVHREVISIMNADLDRLMAEDQADIARLRAAMKLIENILNQHDQFSQEDVKQFEAAMQQLAKFITEQMPQISRPIVRVHPA